MRLDLSLLVALAAPLAAVAAVHRRNHHDLARRADASVQLHKRFSNSRWTFYDVGGAAGACGKFNSPGEHIVALNSAQYGGGYPGPNCWRQIVMTFGGKTTTATITDECPGCPYGGLDLTRGLFQFFASLDKGVLTGEWHFADEGGSPPPSEPKPKPKPKPTTHAPPPPPPTTHHTTSTHVYVAPPTPSTHSSSHSAPTSSSISFHLSSISLDIPDEVTSKLPIPTGTVSAGTVSTGKNEVNNMDACNQLVVNLGGVILAGAEAD